MYRSASLDISENEHDLRFHVAVKWETSEVHGKTTITREVSRSGREIWWHLTSSSSRHAGEQAYSCVMAGMITAKGNSEGVQSEPITGKRHLGTLALRLREHDRRYDFHIERVGWTKTYSE